MNGEAMEGKPAQEHAGNGSHLPPPSHHRAGHPPLREAGSDHRLHHILLAAVRLRLRPALAGAAVPTQALQLPDGLPVPVPAVGRPARPPLLLLLQGLCDGQRSRPLRLLAALLLPCLPAVLHPQPHEPLLRTGLLQGEVQVHTCPAEVQTSSLPALPGRQSHVPGGESGLRPAGEDGRRRREERGPGEGDRQRQPVRPVRRLAVRLSVQGRQDVAGQRLPGVKGHVGVSGGSDRRGGGAAVRVPGLLQPGGARPRRHPDRRLLRLRLVQRVGPGGPALVARRRRLRGVRGDSVRVGAAAHLAGRLLLQGPEAASGPEQRRGPEPRSLLQRILLRQPSSVRQRRRPGVEPSSSELLGQSVLRLLRLGRPPQQLHRPHRQRRAAPDRRCRRAPPLPIIPLFPVQHHFYTVTPITHCVCCFH